MEALPFDQWALGWAVAAGKVSCGAVVAGLLVDLAADPREVFSGPTVAFPLSPAARALQVSPVTVHTALQRLAEAGLLRFRAEDHPDGPHMTVTLLHPDNTGSRDDRATPPVTPHSREGSPV